MKTFPKLFPDRLSLIAVCFALFAAPVWALDIAYDGSPALLTPLFLGENTLVPGGGTPVASDNTVTVDYRAGTALAHVLGGLSSTADVKNNRVRLINGTVGKTLSGGYSSAVGASAGNTVEISGGRVGEGPVSGGYSRDGPASGNTVIISGGSVNGDVMGGISQDDNAVDNTVTLGGNPVFSDSESVLYGLAGGYSESPGDVFTGNTLNLLNPIASTIKSVRNFQKLNFTLPDNVAAGTVMLRVGSGGVFLGDGDENASMIGISLAGSRVLLKPGQTVTLIETTDTITGLLFEAPVIAAAGEKNYIFVLGFDSARKRLFATLELVR